MQIESNASAARTAAPGLAQGDLSAPGSLAEPAVVRTPTWVRHNAWRQTAANAAHAANASTGGAPAVAHGWFGRLRHVLLGRAQTAQASSAQRLAALSLAPARGQGFGLLRTMGRFSLHLRSVLATLKARHQADVAALNAPAQTARPTETIGAPAVRAESAASASVVATSAPETDTQALARVTASMQQRLAAAAQDATRFNATLHQAFGDHFDAAKAETLRQQALAGDFSWAPKIQIATEQQLTDLSGTQRADGAARGCYVQAEDTIYVAAETLHGDADTAQRLLMEEMGHAIDARINTSDAVGDEGEIFSRLVNGDQVSAEQMAQMKADNDHGTVRLNGRDVQVEYGWFKKLVKAVTGGIKKVVGAVAKGVVGVAKSAFKVTTGLVTLNFNRVREGFKEGVQAVVTTVKTVAKAVKDTTKAVLKVAKEAFQKLMQSKLFAAVLMVCRFIPIPVVQLVVRIVDIVRAAYMAYQGIKNKSWGAVLGAVASVAGGAANVAGSLGASAATVANIQAVADAASKLSTAYNAIANKDIGAALSLAGGAFSGNTQASSTIQTLQTVGGYAQQAMALRTAVRSGDALAALSGTLGLAGAAAGKDSSYAGQIATASEVVTGLRAAQALGKGNLDAAQSLASGMASAQAASAQADAIVKQQQQEQAQAQAEAQAKEQARRSLLLASATPTTVSDAGQGLGADIVSGEPYRPSADSEAFLKALTAAMANPPATAGTAIRLDDFGRPVEPVDPAQAAELNREMQRLISRSGAISSTAPDGVLSVNGRNYYLVARDENGVGTYRALDLQAAASTGSAAATGNRGSATTGAAVDIQPTTARNRAWLQVRDTVVQAADSTGVDAGVLAMIANFESGFNTDARPVARDASRNTVRQFDGTMALSTAHGLGQFTDATWLQTVRTHGEEHGIDNAAQMTRTEANQLRTDTGVQAWALAELTRQNIDTGRQLGGTDDVANVYALHNLGGGDGSRFLRTLARDPATPVRDVLGDTIIRNNASLYGNGSISVQDAYGRMGDAMRAGQRFADDARQRQAQPAPR